MSESIDRAHMEAIDRLYLQPNERASKVWQILNRATGDRTDVSKWDILCFSVEFVGHLAVAFEDETFLGHAADLSRWLYSVHYSNPRRLYGEPDRPTVSKKEAFAQHQEKARAEGARVSPTPEQVRELFTPELMQQFQEFLKQREAARHAEAAKEEPTQDRAESHLLDQEHRPDEVHARGEAGGHEGEGGSGG